jgi:hypothetical protein
VSSTTAGTGGGGADGGAGGGFGGFGASGGAGGGETCDCAPGPHGDRIYVLSDGGEVWSYEPGANAFTYVRSLLCVGAETPFSMAVDRTGHAWVMAATTNLVFQLDLTESQGCEPSPYTPHQADFDLFGMSFADPEDDRCEQLYVHSFTGNGPFTEGPGLGQIGAIDPTTGVLTLLATVDYDGGELAGTGDGRLYAFAGVRPAKLVQYDPLTGATLATTPLDGLSKTNASAFALFAGDLYFFTEAPPAGCRPCMMQACPTELDACLADPMCAEQLQCAIDQGDIDDDCGGMMPIPLQDCVSNTCGAECFVPTADKVSQVTRMDLDGTGALEVVHPGAPVRIVGAGDSVCVPPTPL